MGKFKDGTVSIPLSKFVEFEGDGYAKKLIDAVTKAIESEGFAWDSCSTVTVKFGKQGEIKITRYGDSAQIVFTAYKKKKLNGAMVAEKFFPLILKEYIVQKESDNSIKLINICFPIDQGHTVFISNGVLQKSPDSGEDMPMQVVFSDFRGGDTFVRVMAPVDSNDLNMLRNSATQENNVTIGLGKKAKSIFTKSTEELAKALKFGIVLKKDSETVLPGKKKKCVIKRLCVHSEQFGLKDPEDKGNDITGKVALTAQGAASLNRNDLTMTVLDRLSVEANDGTITFKTSGDQSNEKNYEIFLEFLEKMLEVAGINNKSINKANACCVKSVYTKTMMEKLSGEVSAISLAWFPPKEEVEKEKKKPFAETLIGKAWHAVSNTVYSFFAGLIALIKGLIMYILGIIKKVLGIPFGMIDRLLGFMFDEIGKFCARHSNAIFLAVILLSFLAAIINAILHPIDVGIAKGYTLYETIAIISPGLITVAILSIMNPRETLVERIGRKWHLIDFMVLTAISGVAVSKLGVDTFVAYLFYIAGGLVLIAIIAYAFIKNQKLVKSTLSTADSKLDRISDWIASKKISKRIFSNIAVKAVIRIIGAILGIGMTIILGAIAVLVAILCFFLTFGDKELYREIIKMEKETILEIQHKYRTERPKISAMCEVSFDITACVPTMVAIVTGGLHEIKTIAGNKIPDELTFGGFIETSEKLVTGKWVDRFTKKATG